MCLWAWFSPAGQGQAGQADAPPQQGCGRHIQRSLPLGQGRYPPVGGPHEHQGDGQHGQDQGEVPLPGGPGAQGDNGKADQQGEDVPRSSRRYPWTITRSPAKQATTSPPGKNSIYFSEITNAHPIRRIPRPNRDSFKPFINRHLRFYGWETGGSASFSRWRVRLLLVLLEEPGDPPPGYGNGHDGAHFRYAAVGSQHRHGRRPG